MNEYRFLISFWNHNTVDNIFIKSKSIGNAYNEFEESYGIETFPIINIIQID
jgi:hypothetical protein